MHTVQKALFELARTRDLGKMKLREMAAILNVDLPQTIKYHLEQLIKTGLLARELSGSIRVVDPNYEVAGLVQIPILGDANCGEALIEAEDDIRGFLPVAPSILPTRKYDDIFAVQAVGNSMNAADIKGQKIDPGDFVIAQKQGFYDDGDYIVATLEGRANVKRLYRTNNYLVLKSESYSPQLPIYIGEDDINKFAVHGKVISVLKHPTNIR